MVSHKSGWYVFSNKQTNKHKTKATKRGSQPISRKAVNQTQPNSTNKFTEEGQDLCPDKVSLAMHGRVVASGEVVSLLHCHCPCFCGCKRRIGRGKCLGKYVANENKIAHFFQYFAFLHGHQVTYSVIDSV